MFYEGVTVTGKPTILGEGDGFPAFYRAVEPRLRVALVAAYGPERGREATAEALAWAWEHRERLEGLRQPLGFLFRVGQSRTRTRRVRRLTSRAQWNEPWIEPRLASGLRALSERQRVAVVLIGGYGWTAAEVGEVLGLAATTVQNHLERGLARLRSHLEVNTDV